MMNRILVASDLSSRSDRAVERAVQLAQEQGGKIVLMHVIDEDLPATVITRMRQTAEEVLGAVAQSEHAPEDTEIVVETGDPVLTIAEMAEALDVDLVVLGVHKPRPFWDMFSGTTMERLVRALHRPVLLVHDPVTGPYASVLCGVDLSPSCLAAGRTARSLAPKAKITTFHAVHVPYQGMIARNASEKQLAPFVKDAQTRLDAWWDEAAIPEGLPKPEVTPASVHDAYTDAMAQSGADLFALGAHGRMPLSPSLLGGFTEEQIRDPQSDLLVVRG
jgi:nucleotide-binding universal stress UspA family protein